MTEEITTTPNRSRLWIGIGLAALGGFLLLVMLIGGALISLFSVHRVVSTGPVETISIEVPAAPAVPVMPDAPAAPAVPAAPAAPAFTGNLDAFERAMDQYDREMEQWSAQMEREMDSWGADMDQQSAEFERNMAAWETEMDRWSAQMERDAAAMETQIERIEFTPAIRTRSVINGGRVFGNLMAVALVLLGLYLVKRQRDLQTATPVYGPEADRPNV